MIIKVNGDVLAKSAYDIIQKSNELPDNDKYYWGYPFRLAETVLIPYLEKLNAFKKGDKVAEIGSAEGGALAAFVQEGATNALGTDIAMNRLEAGKKIAGILDLPIEFTGHDIINNPPEDKWIGAFDLALLRDVIEHLDDTNIALRNIKKIIKPGGYLFVTFPPYYSPFGGHQHTVANKGGKLPYIHLLPDFIFHKFIASGRENDIGEVKRLKTIRLTAKKFINAAKEESYEIAHKDYYLLRPVFKMKFGLPAIKLTPVSFLPLVKSFFSLEAAYLLKVPE